MYAPWARWSHGRSSAAQIRSAGRDGSAIADESIDFGLSEKWKDKLLTAAQACAAQVRKDAATFNAAFDDGAFGP